MYVIINICEYILTGKWLEFIFFKVAVMNLYKVSILKTNGSSETAQLVKYLCEYGELSLSPQKD